MIGRQSAVCTARTMPGLSVMRPSVNKVGVNLAQGNNGPLLFPSGGAELRQKSRTVALDHSERVLFGKSEIESAPAISAGKSAEPRAESMNQPWNASESFRTHDVKVSLVGSLDRHQNILTIWRFSGPAFAECLPVHRG